jgi:hypothetical protein
MRDPLWIARVCTGKIKQETKSLKILSDVLNRWILGIERELGCELRLNCCPHGGWNCRGAELSALRVKVPTKSLKMPAEEHDVAL